MSINIVKKIVFILIVSLTLFCAFMYIERAYLNYNEEGRFLSLNTGIVYEEQTKEVFGAFTIIGLVITGILFYKEVKNKK